MSRFDDSPPEMHDDSLTPETAERLFDGEILSPEFADLAAMVDDVRKMTSSTPTPAVRGALAEYVGVGLTATESPAMSPAPVALSQDLKAADQPRRRSVFAEVIAFAGTMSGKLLIGGSLAAASVTGAQATGLVDLPLLPEPATVVVADEPPAELPLDDAAQLEDTLDDKLPEVVEPGRAENPDAYPNEVPPEQDEPVEEEPKVEEEKTEEPKADEVPKVEEPKTEEPKTEEPKTEDKPKEEPPVNEEAIAALEAQLYLDKDAVYAAAADLMAPIKADKKVLVQALEGILAPLEQARNDAKAPLYAELETTEDPARKLEIEAELTAIWNQWVLDRDAAAAAANPAIAELRTQLDNIEIERDAEITRLLEQFQAAVDALG